jgi:hypothetical protein
VHYGTVPAVPTVQDRWMNMKPRMTCLSAVSILVLGACGGAADEARVPDGLPETAVVAPAPAPAYTPVVSLNELMVYVLDPLSNELWDAAKTPPTTDAEWNALQRSAVAVAAAGSITSVSGNGPNDQKWTQQADWSTYSQSVSDAGRAALTAVRAKDSAGLTRAGDQLVLACINCHREYKLEVPTIWAERQLPPEEQKRP